MAVRDTAPKARRELVTETPHGRTVTDPYRWLEDGESPECAAWLSEQDTLFARHRGSWAQRETFRELFTDFARAAGAAVPTGTPPVVRSARRFYLDRAPGQQLPVLKMKDPGTAPETLVDPLDTDPAGTTTMDSWRPSAGGGLVAYQMSSKGTEQPLLWVLDVAHRRDVDGPISLDRKSPVAWLPDDTGFYYVTGRPDAGNGRQLLLHILGERSDQDVVVFRTELPQLTVKTSGHGHLMISTSPGATSGNALWLGQIRDASPELIHDGTEDGTRAVLKFAPDGRILAVTDTGAPFGRLCSVDARSPGSSNWRTLVTEEPGVVLTDCAPLADPGTGEPLLLVSKSEHGEGRLLLHDAAGTELHSLTLPGPGTVSRLTTSPAGDHAWFSYTDFVTVPTVYTVDTATRRCVPDSPEQAAPGETSTRPQVRQVSYTSKDGTSVRMYLIGVPPNGDGPRPTLLTAYGGFGASALPGYSPSTLAWVQAGGIYAVASVRGGGEQGTGWHAAGRGPNKPNAIDDFTSAARWLIDEGWTTPDRLAIKGASHSGLLVAGAITREPGRYAAAVCSDALTDMLRYPQFGLGRLWTEEFGSPDDPGELDTLLGYSPYHWVRPGTSYPAVLFTCARVDPRVDSLHTRKMTAALQHANASGAPVVLRCESDVGHGARSMSRQLELQADILAFCAEHTGLVARG